jgi:hypothetical protein
MGKKRIAFRIVVRNPERKCTLERPKHRLEDGNKMDLREVGWDGVNWSYVANDRDDLGAAGSTIMNSPVP